MPRQLSEAEIQGLKRLAANRDNMVVQPHWFTVEDKMLVREAYENGKDYVKLGNKMYGIYPRRKGIVFISPLNNDLTPCGEIRISSEGQDS